MKVFTRKQKRGALSLSLNAIVILILAIAMLGLGLAFIRGIFGQMEKKVQEGLSAGEIQNPPNRDRPITITPPRVDLRTNQKAEIKVAFMNVESSDKTFELQIWSSGTDKPTGCTSVPCQCTVATPCKVPMVFSAQKLNMKTDQINLWTIAVTPTASSLPTGDSQTYLYTVQMTEIPVGTATPSKYTRDFIVVVNS